MKRVLAVSAVGLVVGVSYVALGAGTATQTVRMKVIEASIVDMPRGPFTLTIPATDDGEVSQEWPDNTVYARYSFVTPAGQARILTANWGECDRVPSGCSLELEITGLPPGHGSAISRGITVSSTARKIITTFGSCATGTGRAHGTAFTYTLRVRDIMQSDTASNQAVTVTFTVTDAS